VNPAYCLENAMRLESLLRFAAPIVVAALLTGCGGPKIPREELGKVEWGIHAVPGREEKIILDQLPPPPPATMPMSEG